MSFYTGKKECQAEWVPAFPKLLSNRWWRCGKGFLICIIIVVSAFPYILFPEQEMDEFSWTTENKHSQIRSVLARGAARLTLTSTWFYDGNLKRRPCSHELTKTFGEIASVWWFVNEVECACPRDLPVPTPSRRCFLKNVSEFSASAIRNFGEFQTLHRSNHRQTHHFGQTLWFPFIWIEFVFKRFHKTTSNEKEKHLNLI